MTCGLITGASSYILQKQALQKNKLTRLSDFKTTDIKAEKGKNTS